MAKIEGRAKSSSSGRDTIISESIYHYLLRLTHGTGNPIIYTSLYRACWVLATEAVHEEKHERTTLVITSRMDQ